MNDSQALKDVLEVVRQVEMSTNRLANDTMVGAYLSSFKGRGMDFEELREYMPGDDVRNIDWNVTLRMGRPFVKRFREEREVGMILAVDISASGELGTARRGKRHFAAEVAGTLAFSAARSSDKVGLLLFSEEVELWLPPRKGRRHLLRVLREILFFQPNRRGTRIGSALKGLNHLLHQRSMVFLISDFLQPFDSDLLQVVGHANARHDLICIHLHDPIEADLPRAGLLTFEDSETGEMLELNTSRETVRQRYSKAGSERIAALDSTMQRAGVDILRLRTNEPFAMLLQRFFENRRWRRG